MKRCNHEFRKRFFISRVIEEWNSLPNEVKEANSATIFKRLYRCHRVGTVAPDENDRTIGKCHRAPTLSSGTYADRQRSTDKYHYISSVVFLIGIRSDRNLFGRIRIKSSCTDPDTTKKCHKTKNIYNNLKS